MESLVLSDKKLMAFFVAKDNNSKYMNRARNVRLTICYTRWLLKSTQNSGSTLPT